MKKIIKSDFPFIIAETAFSHEGSKEYLKEMIKQLIGTTNIGIKLQILIDKDEYLTTSSKTYQMIDNWLLSSNDWEFIIKYASENSIPVITAVLDNKSLELVLRLKKHISAIEIHPSCIPDIHFMEKVINSCKNEDIPLILGISGFEINEIDYLFNQHFKGFNKNQLLLMYGFQNYPTNLESLNLKRIQLIRNKYQVRVGYADHTEYYNNIKDYIVSAVYGYGINIIEIHYVLEYGVDRIDYITAYDSNRIKRLYEKLANLNTAFGVGTEAMNNAEKEYSLKFRKIPVYNKKIKKGQKVGLEDIDFKRSNVEMNYKITDIDQIIGKKLRNNVRKDQAISLTELE